MTGLARGHRKVDVKLSWDPAPLGRPAHDLDLVAAVYPAAAPYGPPDYLVHPGRRSPDGTIFLTRESLDGRGFGADEEMSLELYRISERLSRVVIGVAIQQNSGRLTFGEVARPKVALHEGYTKLADHDLTVLAESTAVTVAEFTRQDSGTWSYRMLERGYDTDLASFGGVMGGPAED
ncbi:hypothetical protein SRB5_55360 [Streptomyces sp. RB5]|uniref:TerD domain-containing protein n=1 Tax=Streptomyces smaragdinus TaxID=2585196 RepID=A0A7K0CPE4_9ACTN|nr:hypothetical protein [Streptomyces smaragdinus]